MALRFNEGCRALSWIHAKFDDEEQRTNFARIVYPYLMEIGVNPYAGIFFGKYSRVIDFSHKSAKIAAFHLSKIQEMIQAQGIKCSYSIVLCKPFKINTKDTEKTENKSAINAYTFFKPSNEDLPFKEVLKVCNQIRKEDALDSIEPLWNNSLYPLIVSTGGDNYRQIITVISLLRKKFAWAVDSSSYVTLRINSENYQPVTDKTNGDISAILFFKLASISDFASVNTRATELRYKTSQPSGRLGWYDITEWVTSKTLRELYEESLKIKAQSNGKIEFTSTMLLTEAL